MQVGEVFFLEAALVGEGDGERIAQRQHGGGRSRGCKPQRTRFLVYRAIERDLGSGSESGKNDVSSFDLISRAARRI